MARIAASPAAHAAQAAAGAREGARLAAPWVVLLARIGYAAKGIVYLVIALLAVRAAIGAGGGVTDSEGALGVIGNGPLGSVALGVVGVGLVAFALYSVIAAITGAEQQHDGAKGAALRVGKAGRGLAYGALGVQALRFMTSARSSGGGEGAESWTARLLGMPFGRALVIAIALGIAAYALYQMWASVKKDPRRHFDLSGASAAMATAVERVARFGLAARGVVFLVIAWLLSQAAIKYDPERAGGIADSLLTLARAPYGRLVLGVVALGLASYGLYALAEARWRRMRMA